jgi:hypothetical protein
MLASEKYGVDAPVYKSLIHFLLPNNDVLDELRSELRRLQLRALQPIIEFHCYTELEKDVVYVDGASASLDDVDRTPLSRKHPNLVRFDGPSDRLYQQLVVQHLVNFANRAEKNVKARLKRSKSLYVDPEDVKAIETLLEGNSMPAKKKKLKRTSVDKDVFVKEPAYQAWLQSPDNGMPVLLVKGEEGRGKTQTSLTVLNELDKHRSESSGNLSPAILVAFFLCDVGDDSAEELLKSILLQLIRQDDTLALHVKKFLSSERQTDTVRKGAQSFPHLEHMWQSLQDMLTDDASARQIFIIINNAHHLSSSEQNQTSNSRFFDLLNRELLSSQDQRTRVHRWMFTSREFGQFKLSPGHLALTLPGTRTLDSDTTVVSSSMAMVDLNEAKYWDELKRGIQRHADEQVEKLEMIKKFGLAMPYWAKSIIGNKAPDVRWVDVVCMHLQALPEGATDTKVRKTLERLERDFNVLLRGLWNAVSRLC